MEARRAKTIRLTNTPQRPLSEREIAEATIAFANGARLDIEGLERTSLTGSTGDKELEVLLRILRSFPKSGREPGSPAEAVPQTVADLRANYRSDTKALLSAALKKPEAAAAVLVDRGTEHVVHLRPLLRKVPGGLSLTSYYQFATELDLVKVGQILLIDRERGFLAKLCQCQLEECGDFFFEVKPATGRPQRLYCSREHMLRAHDENASARMARRRPSKPK
jgi:hypothetical protein